MGSCLPLLGGGFLGVAGLRLRELAPAYRGTSHDVSHVADFSGSSSSESSMTRLARLVVRRVALAGVDSSLACEACASWRDLGPPPKKLRMSAGMLRAGRQDCE